MKENQNPNLFRVNYSLVVNRKLDIVPVTGGLGNIQLFAKISSGLIINFIK